VRPAFAFGHGLSYTTFDIAAPAITVHGQGADLRVTVDVEVTNTGRRSGTEVVQVYVAAPDSSVMRPAQELKGFAKVHLAPGESTVAHVVLGHRSFAHWDPGDRYRDPRRPGQGGRTVVVELTDENRGWRVEPGTYEVRIGRSSDTITHIARLDLPGD
jgi:beta-glucosidase